ncbi:4-amino-4-deoxy-L-arabinose-phosphoundecaprenol flippase subunit ArnF [Sulfitobacter sp. THAF37]|nr:EamA family transporter [Sulfitobacter sp. THAF37]QFT58330.1 4-amino-4-deoxy-L-arabinose-phosphoundecaprenol flippase subunit ArnF [Sulfitobacter sp. THAF37]
MSIFYGFALTASTAFIVILGDYLIKTAVDNGQSATSLPVFTGCTLYAVSALLWYFSLKHVTLSQAGVGFSMITLIALCTLGVLRFGETLEFRELAGIGCALAAMILMVRVV